MNHPTIATLRSLYETPSRYRAERMATLDPLLVRARAVRDAYAEIGALADVAHQAATLNLTALARHLRPDLVPVVARLREAAVAIVGRGDTRDLDASAQAAIATLDSASERGWEATIQLLVRDLERGEGSVRALKTNAAVLQSTLAALAAAENLAASAVIVPPMQAGAIAAASK